MQRDPTSGRRERPDLEQASEAEVTPRLTQARFLGRIAYLAALEKQLEAREALRRGEGVEQFFLLEHPSVFTRGRNARRDDLLVAPSWLVENGVEVVESDRGGQFTYHGPGQLVGYPILDLSPDRRDIRRYVRDLQTVLIRCLADFGIEGERRDGPDFIGIWVGERKIASIGVHLSRWLTTHGFALNVSTDLAFFGRIVPCGLSDVQMISIESLLGTAPSLREVAERVVHHFQTVFDRRIEAEWPPASTRVDADAEKPGGSEERQIQASKTDSAPGVTA